MAKLTLSEVKTRIYKVNPNILIIGDTYKNCDSKLHCLCKKCNFEWQASYTKLYGAKTGCPKCARVSQGLKRKHSLTYIKSKVCESVEVLSLNYKDIHSKILCKCKLCGFEWSASSSSLIHQRTRCTKCANKLKKTGRLLFSEAKSRLEGKNSRLVVLKSFMQNGITWCQCRCKKCNFEWQRSFNNLFHKNSQCPNCLKRYSSGELYIKEFLESLGLRHIDGKEYYGKI